MSRVLVTGASGFIGQHCLPLLASKSHEVHAVSRQNHPRLARPGLTWHQADLLRPGCAAELIPRVRPDRLLHLAWYAEPGKFWEARENFDWVRASLELFSAFADRGGKRVVAAGTCAEYDGSFGECSEGMTPLLPASFYGTCKHALQKILESSSRPLGLSSAWGRIFFLYGPYEHPSKLVSYVIHSLLRGEPALCSDGNRTLDFLHVEDVASAFVALLECDVHGPVNIGSGVPVTVREVLEEIGQQLGQLDLIRFGARESSPQPQRCWANTERLVKEVGWVPRYSLARGIQQTIEWWQSSTGMRGCVPPQQSKQ